MGNQEDIEAIQALYAGWRDAVQTGSIPGYLACLDGNIRMMFNVVQLSLIVSFGGRQYSYLVFVGQNSVPV